MIRPAEQRDLGQILALGKEMGHLMLYQKDPGLMERYLPRIIVEDLPGVEIPGSAGYTVTPSKVVGYYHWIQSNDLGFAEMLRCYRQMPESIIKRALDHEVGVAPWSSPLCVCMQGGSHREVFREFILYFQRRFSEIWCYTSIKTARSSTYTALGFKFLEEERFPFFNIHKGDSSTYCLGTWRKADEKDRISLS